MTIKKMAVSAAAAALVCSTVYAGTIKFGNNTSLKVAEELFVAYDNYYSATLATNDVNMTYRADVSQALYGGSISDPLINLSFEGNIQLPAGEFFALVNSSTGEVVALQDSSPVGGIYRLRGTSATSVDNGIDYYIVTVSSATLGSTLSGSATNNAWLSGNRANFSNAKAHLSLWSTSGTPVEIDQATTDLFDIVPQYFVNCENKFNSLINVENGSYTFVSTKHGPLLDINGSTGDRMDVLTSVMKLRVKKDAVDFGLEGNTTRLAITADSNLTNFIAINSDFGNQGVFGAGTNTISEAFIASTGIYELNITDIDDSPNDGFEGNTSSNSLFTVALEANGAVQIPETKFYANMYINFGDYGTKVTPQGAYEPNAFIGEWKNFAYIAQIPGATQTAATKTKLFITNRGCKAVSPQLKFILDGKVVEVTLDEIPVDTQAKYLLGDVIAANIASFSAAGMSTEGRYSLEITIPGNAEDYYVYAQAQSQIDLSATKDLPVYNTSTRSY